MARCPGPGERGRGAAACRRDRRLRAGIALAVVGFGLAATAVVSPVTGGIEIPALHDSASDKPIRYTPVCADVSGGGFQVCLHPACAQPLGVRSHSR